MTTRARQVYALLRTMLNWVPPTRGRSAELASSPGFNTGPRATSCPDCLTNGRIMFGCETCHGSGELIVEGKDPMDDPVKNPPADPRRLHAGWGGASREAQRDLVRLRDNTIERLQQDARVRRGEEATPDQLTAAIDAHDRLYRTGSYHELDQALDWLRNVEPTAYLIAMGVACHPLHEPPIEPVDQAVIAICELLAHRMPAIIRVPGFVQVWTHEELAQQAREAKESLWRGRHTIHELKRHERAALIRALAESGETAGQIAHRVHLTKRRVEQILEEPNGDEQLAC